MPVNVIGATVLNGKLNRGNVLIGTADSIETFKMSQFANTFGICDYHEIVGTKKHWPHYADQDYPCFFTHGQL